MFAEKILGKLLYLAMSGCSLFAMVLSFRHQWSDIHSHKDIVVVYHHFSTFLIFFLFFNFIGALCLLSNKYGAQYKSILKISGMVGMVILGAAAFRPAFLTDLIFSEALIKEGYTSCESFDVIEKQGRYGTLVHRAYCRNDAQ